MKIPRRPIFFIGPCFLLDVARPHPAKPFNSHHARHASPVDPVQCTFRDFQRLVQSSDSQTCFIESTPAIPSADERRLPLPLRDGGRLSTQFPTAIQPVPKCCSQL